MNLVRNKNIESVKNSKKRADLTISNGAKKSKLTSKVIKIINVLIAVIPGLIVAGLIFGANIYYNLDSQEIMMEETTKISGSLLEATAGFTVSGGTTLISGTGVTVNPSGATALTAGTTLTASSTDEMIFATAGEERMRILTSGYIGIATTTPSYPLHVWGDAGFGTTTDINTPVLYVDSGNGRVGIGTVNPSMKLEVVGDIKMSGAYSHIIYSDSSSVFEINTDLIEINKAGFTSVAFSGNVGIATTTPAHPFVVNSASANDFYVDSSGNVGVSGDIIVGGSFSYTGKITPIQYDIGSVATDRWAKLGQLTGLGGIVTIRVHSGSGYGSENANGYSIAQFKAGNVDNEFGGYFYSIGQIDPTMNFEWVDDGVNTMGVYIYLPNFFRGSIEIIEGNQFTLDSAPTTLLADPSGTNLTEEFRTWSDIIANTGNIKWRDTTTANREARLYTAAQLAYIDIDSEMTSLVIRDAAGAGYTSMADVMTLNSTAITSHINHDFSAGIDVTGLITGTAGITLTTATPVMLSTVVGTDLQIRSYGGIALTLDDDNNNASVFKITNGADATIFSVTEQGSILSVLNHDFSAGIDVTGDGNFIRSGTNTYGLISLGAYAGLSAESGQGDIFLGFNAYHDPAAANSLLITNTHGTAGFSGIKATNTGIDFHSFQGSVTANNAADNVVMTMEDGKIVSYVNHDFSAGIDVTGATNFAGGTTYKVESDGDAVFKDLTVSGTTFSASSATASFSQLNVTATTTLATTQGNVGIGDTTPSDKLEVSGTIRLTNSADKIQWSTAPQNQYIMEHWGIEIHGGSARPVQMPDTSLLIGYDQTDGTDRGTGTLLVSGNVGIATTTPQAKLHIVQTAAADAFRVDDSTNETTPFVIDQNGDVGIGIASPAAKLHIDGTVTVNDIAQLQSAAFTQTITGNAISVGPIIGSTVGNISIIGVGPELQTNADITNYYGVSIWDPSVGGSPTVATQYQLYIQTPSVGTTKWAIYSAGGNNYFGGNVGIATTSPRFLLDVWGDAGFGTTTDTNTPVLYVDSGNGRIGISTTTPAYPFVINSASANDFYVDSSGNVVASGSITGTTLTDGVFSVSSGVITGASGNISLWTNDSGYLTNVTSTNMSSDDFGDFSCNGTDQGCSIDADALNADEIEDIYFLIAGDVVTGSSTIANYFTAGTSTTFFVDSGNSRVGIGTTNPDESFHVVGGNAKFGELAGGTQTNSIRFNRLASTDSLNVRFTEGDADKYVIGLRGGSDDLSFSTAGTLATTQMMIQQSTGNVGIGTTGPTYKLDIYGAGDLFRVASSTGDIFKVSETQIESAVPHSFTSAGDVSIAYDLQFTNQTASYIKSNAPLYIEAGEIFESNDLTLRTFNNGDLVFDLAGGASFAQAQAWDLADSATSSLNIESGLFNLDTLNSRVGIGTTEPENKLHVYTNSGQGTIKIGGNTTEGRGILTYDHTNNYLDLVAYKNGYGDVIVSNGNVGIATTSPRFLLDAWGDVGFGTTTDTNTPVLYVDSGNGRIGIATTTPSYALDVIGSIKSTDTFVFSDNTTQSIGVRPNDYSWNIGTMYDEDNYYGVVGTVINDVFFSPDGTKMYEVGKTKVYQHTLSTPWDISTAAYASKSLTTESTDSTDIFFKPDGIKLYIAGDAEDNSIYQYTCSTPWDLATCSYDSVVKASQSVAPESVFFSPDGRKMYEVHDGGINRIYQSSLSIPWDLSTATYDSISKATINSDPKEVYFSPDGRKMYEVGITTDYIYQYSLSTPWDLSTATYDSISVRIDNYYNAEGVFFKPDGTSVYFAIGGPLTTSADDRVYEYTLGFTTQGKGYFRGNVDVDAGIDVTGATNFAGGTTYKVDSSGNATFLDLTVSGSGTHSFGGTIDPTNVAAFTLTGLETMGSGQTGSGDYVSGTTPTVGLRWVYDTDVFSIFGREDTVGEFNGLIMHLGDNTDDYFQIEQVSPGGEATPVKLLRASESAGIVFYSAFTLGDGGDLGSINTSDWGISSTGLITNASMSSTQLTDGGTIIFDWIDDEVADTLTIGNSGTVDADALGCDVGNDNLISKDCIGDVLDSSEITDIYVFNSSDTMSGSLQVGTTLTVIGTINASGNIIYFGEAAQTIEDRGDYITIWNQTTDYFNFYTAGTYVGNIGVGLINPSERLYIADGNILVCTGGSCPSYGFSGTGNLGVEGDLTISGNTFRMDGLSTAADYCEMVNAAGDDITFRCIDASLPMIYNMWETSGYGTLKLKGGEVTITSTLTTIAGDLTVGGLVNAAREVELVPVGGAGMGLSSISSNDAWAGSGVLSQNAGGGGAIDDYYQYHVKIPDNWNNSATYKIVVVSYSWSATTLRGTYDCDASAYAIGETKSSNNLFNNSSISPSGGIAYKLYSNNAGTSLDINGGDIVEFRMRVTTVPSAWVTFPSIYIAKE